MISRKSIVGTAALFGALVIVSTPAFAQRDAGLVGKQYAGLTVFTEDVRSYDTGTGIGGGLTVNVPASPNVDIALATSYERFGDIHLTDKRLSGTVVAYQEVSGMKVFLDGTLGGTWQSVSYGGSDVSNNDGLYGFGFGAEAPVAPATAIFGRIAYNRYFDSSNGDYWTFTLGLNHWISEKLGLIISATAYESDSVVYSGGLTLRF